LVTPLGLTPTRRERATYWRTWSGRRIGTTREPRCPHVTAKGCGIWQSRNATCATFFCLHEDGDAGRRFWATLDDALTVIERELARWCAEQVGLAASALALLVGRDDAARPHDTVWLEPPPPGVRTELWKPFGGPDEDYFLACAERVRALDGDAALAICRERVPGLDEGVARVRDARRAIGSPDFAGVG
jgi:hypothetical protein